MTWLLTTVGTTALTTAAKLVALLGSSATSRLDFSSLTLSSVCDFAYTGIGCGLAIVLARSRPTRGPRRLMSSLIRIVAALIFMGGMFWGFVVRSRLPTRWSDLSPVSETLLVAALALTLATYFHTPEARSRARPRLVRSPSRTGPSEFTGRPGLTGLPRLLVHEYVWSAGLAGFLIVVFGTVVFAGGGLMNSPASYGGFLQMQRLLLFDNATAQTRGTFFDLIIWFSLFMATLASRFTEMIRHLRVLPIGATRLTMLLVGWPALMLATVWAVLLVLHYAVLGGPVASLRPALFLALVGSSALMKALTLRWPRLSGWIFGASISVTPIVRLVDGPSSVIMATLGLGAIVAAAALTHVALRHGSTYRQPPRLRGVAAAQRWS